ncbi:MAG: hypothetical protein DHS20C02_19340 [Micavibrio sp.]|nr:MAG: hypothetical protein DHS20C02_19340 [Micavibrio sp.]
MGLLVKDIGKIRRLIAISLVLALFVAPLAYAQSGVFIGANKNKDSVENKRPSIFIRPGKKSSKTARKSSKAKKGVYIGKNSFRDDSRISIYRGAAKTGTKLVMPNMDMRGNKTPTQEDLIMMVVASRQGDFETMQKNSALTLQKVERNRAVRKEKRRKAEERTGKVASRARAFQQSRSSKTSLGNNKTAIVKKKRQVFVRKNRSSGAKPKRIFNAYD